MTYDAIIIGAGISGLSAGYYLRKQQKNILIIEAADHVGGLIASKAIEGFQIEYGPNTLRNPGGLFEEMLLDLGLESEILSPSASIGNNYVAYEGKLHPVPRSLPSLLKSQLVGVNSLFSVIAEPFKRKPAGSDETVAAFFTKRFGRKVTDRLVKPFVSGIFAGDAEKLLMKYAFPEQWAAAHEYGSVIRGSIKTRRKPIRKLPKILSFKQGLSTLTIALGESLKDSIMTGTRVTAISKEQHWWQVSTEQGSFSARSVISTLPMWQAATLFDFNADLLPFYPPITVVHLGYADSAISSNISGFGFLTAPSEHSDILGCIFSSSLFPDRAPKSTMLFTILMGGATNPSIGELDETTLISKAHTALSSYLNITAPPLFTQKHRLVHSIPQYNAGYEAFLSMIESYENRNEGLHFLGNFRGGISVINCIRNAHALISKVTAA